MDIDLNVAVLTTKEVWKTKEIVWAFHYEDDGMWGFFGYHDATELSDYMIVSLDEIMHINDSVIPLMSLPLGYSAKYCKKKKCWMIFPK